MPKYVSEGGTGTEGGRRTPKIKVGGVGDGGPERRICGHSSQSHATVTLNIGRH